MLAQEESLACNRSGDRKGRRETVLVGEKSMTNMFSREGKRQPAAGTAAQVWGLPPPWNTPAAALALLPQGQWQRREPKGPFQALWPIPSGCGPGSGHRDLAVGQNIWAQGAARACGCGGHHPAFLPPLEETHFAHGGDCFPVAGAGNGPGGLLGLSMQKGPLAT